MGLVPRAEPILEDWIANLFGGDPLKHAPVRLGRERRGPHGKWRKIGDPGEPQWLQPNKYDHVSSAPVAFTKDNSGIVHLRGAILLKSGLGGSMTDDKAFILPEGYQPANAMQFFTVGITPSNKRIPSAIWVLGEDESYGYTDVEPGLVWPSVTWWEEVATNGVVYCDNVHYPAYQSGAP